MASKQTEKVLVLDIGAGTTDVAALNTTFNEKGDKVVEPIHGGNFKCCVGGADIDKFIIDKLKKLVSKSIFYAKFQNMFMEMLLQSELKQNMYMEDFMKGQCTFSLLEMNFMTTFSADDMRYLVMFLKHMFDNLTRNQQLREYFSVQYNSEELSADVITLVEQIQKDGQLDPTLIEINAKPKVFYDALQNLIHIIMNA